MQQLTHNLLADAADSDEVQQPNVSPALIWPLKVYHDEGCHFQTYYNNEDM